MGPGRKPRRPVFSQRGSNLKKQNDVQPSSDYYAVNVVPVVHLTIILKLLHELFVGLYFK